MKTSSRFRPCALVVSLIFCALAACAGSSAPTSSSQAMPLSESIQTGPFVFYFSPADSVETERQLAFHEWATAELKVAVDRPISFYKYRSRHHMGDLTGTFNTNAYADSEKFAIHTVWPFDNHEPVHLYTSLLGRPVGLWSEGVAVALQTDPHRGDLTPNWSGEPVHEVAARLRRRSELMPLEAILETEAFAAVDDSVRYVEAGSFVQFLLVEYGLDRLRKLIRKGSADDSKATVSRTFEAIYGRSILDIEHDWLTFLDTL